MIDILLKGYETLEEGVLITNISGHPVFLIDHFWVNLKQRDKVFSLLKNGIFEKIPVRSRNKAGEIREVLLSGLR